MSLEKKSLKEALISGSVFEAGNLFFFHLLPLFTFTSLFSSEHHNIHRGGVGARVLQVQRVVEGCFSLQRRHCETVGLGFDMQRAQREAAAMYRRHFIFLNFFID